MSQTVKFGTQLALASISFLTLIGTQTANATPASTAELALEIPNIETAEGKLIIALFKGEAQFKAYAPERAKVVAVTDASADVLFAGLEPGDYAIRLFQDVNGDDQLSLGKYGIPSEPFGFSNDAKPSFGPARWEASRFEVKTSDNSQTVHLQRAGK